MSNLETPNIPNNLQELLSTLLKLSTTENPHGGPTVIKLGNDLVTLNISKISEPIANIIPNTQDLIPKNLLNLNHLFSKETFHESPSPLSLNQQNSGSLKTADFNAFEVELPLTKSNSNVVSGDVINEKGLNIMFKKKENQNLDYDSDNNSNKPEENNFKSFGEGFSDFHSNTEIFHENMGISFGRLSFIPKHKKEEDLEKENNQIIEIKNIYDDNNDIIESGDSQKNLDISINQNKNVEIQKVFENNNNLVIFEEKHKKIDDFLDETEADQNRTKNALDFMNSFIMAKTNNDNKSPCKSPQKPFSSNFLNEMKNIPINENNNINPYSYINVFSKKSPEILNNKLADETKLNLVKKNSIESENTNKNHTSPIKTKKQLITPLKPVINPNTSTKQAININPTNIPLMKKKINPPPKVIIVKKSQIIKERTSKNNTIKEVNEEPYSNEDSKSIKEKQYKTSTDLEKNNLKSKEMQNNFEEDNKKASIKSDEDNKKIAVKINETKASFLKNEENTKKNHKESPYKPTSKPTKPLNEIKMELPEFEMEENLKFLMEKTDRSNEVGEKMFQTINSLLKYKEHLKTKEKSLLEKEKIFVEFEQKSKSSTQWSYDTKSTLNGADPLKALLEEFYKEKKTDFELYMPPSEADIHFLFLYSSPLITFFRDKEGKIGKRPIYNEIDIVNEWKTLQDILPESKREIKFMKSSASIEKIGMIFDRNPTAIHFCGHGVKNTEENFGLVSNEEVGDFLIFEDLYGGADFVSCMTLSKLLNKLKNRLHFAFVASCHSKLVGEVFLNAGASHVICVKREERILDKACQIFTKAFYNACFTGKKTICEAFEIAKEQIRANGNLPKGEENKFVILIKQQKNQSIYDEHKCIGWVDLGPGSFKDLTLKPEFNQIPSQVENFLGRNEIMHEIINLILTNRFITIKGIPGIGKSSLAKEVGRYIYERNHFKNGIIYLQLVSCQNNEAVTSCLDSKVFPNSSFKQIESKKENTLKMLYQIIDNLRNKELLIIMDNVDMVLANFYEKEKFQGTLSYLLSNCNNLKILITSRTPIGGFPLADCIERLYNLSHLNNEDAKNLFLMRSPRPISSQEISDLLLLISSEFEEDKNFKPKENTFSNHQFMELFGGHPQAITLGAALLYERSLKDLFNYLQTNSIVNILHLDPYLSEREKKTFNSLKASLDASWAILYEKNKIAAKFFSLLGLLPGGASEEDFQAIWGDHWQDSCDVLLRSSLLIKSQKNDLAFYTLFPFMTKYAEEHIKIKDKREFHQKIMEYYHKKIQKIFKMIGTLSNESSKAVDELQEIEFNVRACIFRELSFQGSKELEKSLYENYSTLNVTNSIENVNSISSINKSLTPNETKINDDDDFVPLTKENLEIHQKRYELVTSSKLSNQTSKKSKKSTSPICINEKLANYLKSPSMNNDEEDSEKKINVSYKKKTISISNTSAKDISKNRLAITPSDNNEAIQIENTTDSKPNLEDINIDQNESKSESNTPKFSKNEQIKFKGEEILLEKNNFDNLTSIPNEKIFETDTQNSSKIKPIIAKDKKNLPPNSKNSISSTARPSNSLTGQDNPQKSGKPLTKPIVKYKIPMKFSYNKTKIYIMNKILIYYSSTLFLLRRYSECNKMIVHGLRLADKIGDKLAFANFKRISGSVQYIKKNFQQALKEFIEAEEIFKEIGCSLGICISQAAIGYIKYVEGEYNQSKNYLELALKIYDSLNHIFGIHFMNRWLANVKRKIPGFTTQTKKHIEAAQQIIRNKNKFPVKNNNTNLTVLSKHKGGYFILRWMGDGISIFIESAFKIDIEGKKSKTKTSLTAKNSSNIPPQISASEDMIFKNELLIPSLVKSESQKKKEAANKQKINKEEEKIIKEEKIINNRPALIKKKK